MKKFFLSFFTIIIFALYVAYERANGTGASPLLSFGASNVAFTTSSNQTSSAPVSSGQVAQSAGSAPKPSTSKSSSANSSSNKSSSASSGSNSGTAASTVAQGQYKNGTYTGQSADAFYGNVQVQVAIQNGQITDVQFLDYPHDRNTSQFINSQAVPLLRSEAIQAQSAQVDIVSGATATSQAFQQSLASALVQAKA